MKRFLSIDDLTHLPKPKWLVEGVFEANSLIMLYGPPASYKSFLCLDWLLCMAAGRNWLGRQTTPCKVLYVLGEGKANLLKRIQAWLHYNQVGPEERARINQNFKVSFEVPQMAVRVSVDSMLAALNQEGYQPDVIAVDTFARSFVGLDESSPRDVGLWVESADRLRNLGYTVIFLHHTKKNIEFGLQYRGSTAIMGAMDTALVMSAEKRRSLAVLEITKQKDHDEGEPIKFNRTVVTPPGGDPSVVLVPAAVEIDERFTEEGQKIEALLGQLLEDATFESDRSRARELARQCGITESAAQSRIARRRRNVIVE